jgi:flagellar basal body-associated protein FliL
MNKKKIIILIIIAVVAISIGLYTIPPLFTNTVVDEPLPAASGMNLANLDAPGIQVISNRY